MIALPFGLIFSAIAWSVAGLLVAVVVLYVLWSVVVPLLKKTPPFATTCDTPRFDLGDTIRSQIERAKAQFDQAVADIKARVEKARADLRPIRNAAKELATNALDSLDKLRMDVEKLVHAAGESEEMQRAVALLEQAILAVISGAIKASVLASPKDPDPVTDPLPAPRPLPPPPPVPQPLPVPPPAPVPTPGV